MAMLLAVVLALGLVVTASSAVAETPLVRTLATAHGVGHVTVGASTDQLRSRLWVQRIGGTGAAPGSGYVSCESKTTSAGDSGSDEDLVFSLPPSSRQMLWRFAGAASCVVTVSVRGNARLVLSLRGY
jgi:hypothetical protein